MLKDIHTHPIKPSSSNVLHMGFSIKIFASAKRVFMHMQNCYATQMGLVGSILKRRFTKGVYHTTI